MMYVFMFLGMSFLSWLSTRNRALFMIKEISSNSKYYPKWYALPGKWIRKIYKLNNRFIPKYLYLELILSLIYAMLGPINLLIVLLLESKPIIAGWLFVSHACLVLVDSIFFVIMSCIMKKR